MAKVGISVADPNGVVFHSPGQRPGFAVARQFVHPKGVTPSRAARRSTSRVAPRLGLVDATFPRAAPGPLVSCPLRTDGQDPAWGCLAGDLTARHGRAFSVQQALVTMRGFCMGGKILPTPSGNSGLPTIAQTPSAESMTTVLQPGSFAAIPSSWSREGGEVE